MKASSYIFVDLDVPGWAWGSWCSSNADFYVQSYLSLGSAGGSIYSGGWEKYYRNRGEAWSDAVYQSYVNSFGWACGGDYSWCSESQLAGNINLYPASGSYDYESSASGATVTITVGPTRESACGF